MINTCPLTVQNLSVKLGRSRILHDLNFTITRPGQVVGLFGQNGAGKTTLIRALAGQINVYDGAIGIGGNGQVGYLPDRGFLPGKLTYQRVIHLCQRLFDDFDADIAQQILNDLELSLKQKVSSSSKGMLEQVHLAMILARRCDFYVMDEPLAAVDPLTRDTLMRLIESYRKEGSTVLISTHLIQGLQQLFDEALVVHNGRVILQQQLNTESAKTNLEDQVKETIYASQA